MTDLISLLAGGGFALGGAYLGPFMQRVQRRDDRRSDYRALIRDKAEIALVLLAKLRAKANAAALAVFETQGRSAAGSLDELHELYAVIAVYFPSLLSLFDDFRAHMAKELEKLSENVPNDSNEEIAWVATTCIAALCAKLEAGLAAIVAKNMDFS